LWGSIFYSGVVLIGTPYDSPLLNIHLQDFTMKTTSQAIAAIFLSTGLVIPGVSSASSLWHENNRENGATFHPDHVKSNKTRADVKQELELARRDGSLWYLQRGLPIPVKASVPGKTREEVRNELPSMSSQERKQFETSWGGGN
jgi:Domain of unknown function (DUF4148)